MTKLDAVFQAAMPTQVAYWSTLHPSEVLPDINSYYQDEYEYEQLADCPALILFEEEPEMEYIGDRTIVYTLPIPAIVWDVCDVRGTTELHRRLKRWRSLMVDEILCNHRAEPGYWESVALRDYVGTPLLVNDGGVYGRAQGVRFIFQVQEEY